MRCASRRQLGSRGPGVALAALCALVLVACGSAPDGAWQGPYAPRKVQTLETWPVLHGGEEIGKVKWIDIEDRAAAIRFFRVENPDGQVLGMIDRKGRVYRNVPFVHEEQFCGIYPMREGLALLFEIDGSESIEVPGGVAAVEAAATREQAGR